MQSTFEKKLEQFSEVGFVEQVWQSQATISGLPSVTMDEIVEFEDGCIGQVMMLKQNEADVLVFTNKNLQVGTKVVRTGSKLAINISESLLGKTMNGLGKLIEGEIKSDAHKLMVDVIPEGIASRKIINQPLHTGVPAVDLLVPLGKGQRELIIGDRKTGKSIFLLQAALTQMAEGTVCVYAAIAKKKSEIKNIDKFFVNHKVRNNCVLVATSSQDSPGEIFMTPYTAMTVAEYFRDKGREVLVILDDLSAHAVFYRELSLISRKFPGRDSYPGDIFHVHSKLMERAGNFDVDGKDVAITCLPVAETIQGEMTGYIQTNLMSMTDGHIYFDGELFFKGRRPPVNAFVSVTRVGRQTQTRLAREIGSTLMNILANYEKTQSFLRFGAELGEGSRQTLAMGERVLAYFDQPMDKIVPYELQLVLFGLVITGIWNGKNTLKIIESFETDANLRQLIEEIIKDCDSQNKLIEKLRPHSDKLMAILA